MENSIASCHWQACDTCKNAKDAGSGCEVEEAVDYELDSSSDSIICTEWVME